MILSAEILWISFDLHKETWTVAFVAVSAVVDSCFKRFQNSL